MLYQYNGLKKRPDTKSIGSYDKESFVSIEWRNQIQIGFLYLVEPDLGI